MKKVLLLLTCLSGLAALDATTYTSRVILNIAHGMPVDPTLYYLFSDYFTNDREEKHEARTLRGHFEHFGNDIKTALNVLVWGGKTNQPDDIARYLLPFDKTTLLVREGYGTAGGTNTHVDVPGNQDLVAENFNIVTNQGNFCSTLAFKPRQSFVGFGISGYCQLSNKWWVAFQAPVVHVRNTVDMVETVTFSGGGPVTQTANITTEGFNFTPYYGTMTDAFKSRYMLYGKVDGPQSKTGFAYVNLTAGYTYLQEEKRTLQLYTSLIIPTSNKPKAIYMFESLYGNNKHWGIILGSFFTRKYETKRFTVNTSIDSNTQYLFPNTQTRSFDLGGKPWSRYLGIYANEQQRETSATVQNNLAIANSLMAYQTWGINYFTQKVTVHPYFVTDLVFNASFELPRGFAFDIGFKAFWKQGEDVELKNPWVLGPMIGKLSDATTDFPAECAPVRGINDMYSTTVNAVAPGGNITSNAVYIRASDLDLESAAQPFRSDYTLYVASHRIVETKHMNKLIGQLGASYIFGANNATADRWQLWLGGSCYF